MFIFYSKKIKHVYKAARQDSSVLMAESVALALAAALLDQMHFF
jgi:hypothetical protein